MRNLVCILFVFTITNALAQKNAVLFENSYIRVTAKYSTFLVEERTEVDYEVLDKTYEKTVQVKVFNATLIDSLHSPLVLKVPKNKGHSFAALYFYSLDGLNSKSLATVWVPVRTSHASAIVLKSEYNDFFVSRDNVGGQALLVDILVGESTVGCKSFFIRRGTVDLIVKNTVLATKEIVNTSKIDLKPFWNRAPAGGEIVVKVNRYSCRLEDGLEIEPVLDESMLKATLSTYAPTQPDIYMSAHKKK